MNKWKIRTVKNGMIKIDNCYFRPYENKEYEQHLSKIEGKKLVFSRYVKHGTSEWEDFISLWGTIAQLKGIGDNRDIEVNGVLPWTFWEKVDIKGK